MLHIICWLLPASTLKNRILRRFGHDVSDSAVIGPNLVVGVKKFVIADHARIEPFNAFRGLSHVRIEAHGRIGSWNWISAHPVYQEIDPDAGTLYVGYCAALGSRGYLDVSGTFIVREYSLVGGNRVFIQTHEPDFSSERQTVGRISVGHHSMVASRAVMLKGTHLPAQSLLAANSTMTRNSAPDGRPGLYAGSPAHWKRETPGRFFERTDVAMTVHVVEDDMGITEADLPSGQFRAVPAHTPVLRQTP